MNVDYFGMCKGQSLRNIGHAADLIWIIIGNISIHLSSNALITLDGQTIAQTQDLYVDADGNSTRYVERNTLFDRKIVAILDKATEYRVEMISVTATKNIHIVFSNGLRIETLEDEDWEDEKWRILIKSSGLPHMVGYSDGIEWH